MLYLLLKELAPFADNVFVTVNSLLKDMSQGKNDEFKANAIRALRKIITDVWKKNITKNSIACHVYNTR